MNKQYKFKDILDKKKKKQLGLVILRISIKKIN
jgi:hypothetical protein